MHVKYKYVYNIIKLVIYWTMHVKYKYVYNMIKLEMYLTVHMECVFGCGDQISNVLDNACSVYYKNLIKLVIYWTVHVKYK
jgi:hypothetical protein